MAATSAIESLLVHRADTEPPEVSSVDVVADVVVGRVVLGSAEVLRVIAVELVADVVVEVDGIEVELLDCVEVDGRSSADLVVIVVDAGTVDERRVVVVFDGLVVVVTLSVPSVGCDDFDGDDFDGDDFDGDAFDGDDFDGDGFDGDGGGDAEIDVDVALEGLVVLRGAPAAANACAPPAVAATGSVVASSAAAEVTTISVELVAAVSGGAATGATVMIGPSVTGSSPGDASIDGRASSALNTSLADKTG